MFKADGDPLVESRIGWLIEFFRILVRLLRFFLFWCTEVWFWRTITWCKGEGFGGLNLKSYFMQKVRGYVISINLRWHKSEHVSSYPPNAFCVICACAPSGLLPRHFGCAAWQLKNILLIFTNRANLQFENLPFLLPTVVWSKNLISYWSMLVVISKDLLHGFLPHVQFIPLKGWQVSSK